MGSSPRVRSGLSDHATCGRPIGIISACAERSRWRSRGLGASRDHLRVCGAVIPLVILRELVAGSSPRVRSGRCPRTTCPCSSGIISACAERSTRCRQAPSLRRLERLVQRRIISACAERSSTRSFPQMSHWDHLRVCGAVASFASTRYSQRGSSPRVRSGLVLLGFVSQNLGIISACAERSMVCRPSSPLTRDHLRVCGAVIVNDGRDVTEHGSSPRVRSGRRRIVRHAACRGIISACAERSLDCGMLTAWRRDHLRVCGAVSFGVDATNVNKGSSPRVRSGPVRVAFAHDGRGIISACAERSVVFYWDLVRLDGAECLIRTLCGVVEWRCSRYLEWMLSILAPAGCGYGECWWSPAFGRALKEA